MFRESNQEFMMSFEGEAPVKEKEKNSPPKTKRLFESCNIGSYQENKHFSMGLELEDNSEISETFGYNQEKMIDSVQPSTIPRVSHLKPSRNQFRKFSCAVQDKIMPRKGFKEVNIGKPISCIKSQDSLYANSEDLDDNPTHIMPSQKEDFPENPNPEVHPPEQAQESLYMKKIRALQTKFKKLSLRYQTTQMNLRQENKAINKELSEYKQYISSYYPKIQQQIAKKIAENQENNNGGFDFSSSNSSVSSEDDKNNEISMPVISQIMEIKIEGKKLCDKIADLEASLKKALQKGNQDQKKAETQVRKWSIPVAYNFQQSAARNCQIMPRYKKQSFQTTIISDQQNTSKQKPTSNNGAECLCSSLKRYIIKFNSSLHKINTRK